MTRLIKKTFTTKYIIYKNQKKIKKMNEKKFYLIFKNYILSKKLLQPPLLFD